MGDAGCQVYEERPLICRLCGTTSKLAYPKGKWPDQMIDTHIEQQINRFFQTMRQVLV